jgi:MFS family permease
VTSRPPRRHVVVLALCAAEILSMAAFAMFPALQPTLREEWRLSNTAAGWISGMYYGGYMMAVPVLTGLTDRVDPRRVWLLSAALAAGAAAAFSTVAGGLWSALACQFLAGVGLAGTFMPGLKLLADATEGARQARFIAFYTTSFTIGSSASFYVVGALADLVGWRAAVLGAAAGPAAAFLVVGAVVPAHASRAFTWTALWDMDFRPVLRSSASMRYVYGYVTHMWELFALRAWLVPFLAFSQSMHPEAGGLRPTTVAALIALLGVPASLVGNELGTRYGRTRVIPIVMLTSLGLSVAAGLSSPMPWTVVVLACCAYGVVISADSAALTSGLVASAAPDVRGASMALYSMAGFAGAFAGSLAVGGVLDALGGQSTASWAVAFAAMGLPALAGFFAVRRAAGAPDPTCYSG